MAEGWVEYALISLIDSGTLTESLKDLNALRKDVLIRGFKLREEPAEEATVTAAPQGPTEADLDQAVINDWSNLVTSEIRSKCRNADYKQRFDRLMAAGKLGR